MQREAAIQKAIHDKLTAAGWFVIRITLAYPSGLPDLFALRSGQMVFIEVKRPGNKPTPLQNYRHKQLRELGYDVRVVDNLKEINSLIS